MAREAAARAVGRSVDNGEPEARSIGVRNIVWLRPLVVGQEPVEVHIGLFPEDGGEVGFEVYSRDTEQKIVHCQGRAVLSSQPAPGRLDIEQLKEQMGQGRSEPSSVYAAFARMGFAYGPAHQGISAIHRGSDQLLAHLRLPRTVENTSGDYVLHPSVMDSALQATVGLIDGWSDLSNETRLPFALESLRIVSACTKEMVAWVRYSPGSQAADKVVKLDIDLCDERGDICVQMHGFSSRVQSKDIETAAAQDQAIGSLLAAPVWQASSVEASADAGKLEFPEHHVVLCELSKVNSSKLEALVSRSHCLSLHAGQQPNIAQRYSEYALACFERIQAILQSKPQGKVLVQIVVADHQEQAVLAGLSGLLKTAALENPQFIGQLIFVPVHTTAEELTKRLQAERPGPPDALIRYDEQGGRQVLRWEIVPADPETSPIAFKDHGVYLITGGLGGLGVLFAREILDQTREARVVLTGRSALSPEKRRLVDGLSTKSGQLSYRQVDLGNLDQVEQLIAAIKDEYGQLTGILHCAGMIADNFILKKGSAQFREVLVPKVTGTYNLDQASLDVDLDFFVLFSSIAGAIGNVGQADYAAANGFMDQFAAYRSRQVAAKQRHGRTRSINWPLWQAGGMNMDSASRELLQRTTGLQPMQTATGLRAFHRSLALPYRQTLVMEGELAQIRRALLDGPAVSSQPQAEQPVAGAGIEGETLAEQTQEYLRRQLSDELKLPSQKIDPQAALKEYGIDSILAMQLTNRLEQTFGSLSKTLFFEYQTIRELSEYFIAHHSPRLTALFAATANRAREAAPVAAQAPPRASTTPVSSRRFLRARSAAPDATTEFDAIAIIGLSGRYPEAVNVDAYWDNLREGKDCIIEVPRERWDWRAYFSEDRNSSGRHYSKWGGFIAGADEFDPLFFNISPREAKYIDPQERLFLQHAWMAVEDAGYTRASLQVPYEQDLAGQVGVYVGVMWSEYQLFGAEAGVQDLTMGFAGNVASIANRVSYALNLHGPSMTLDTMCSSSLTAIHVACQDLKLGRTSLAIAGGVNVSVHSNKYRMLSAGQFISSDGHCQSFGEGGDGYIPGEGVGVVVLKRLSEAKRDGDHIYGIIRGSALNHGGKTNGYTVPNPQAQAIAISRALAESRTDARHISYIEAHGTGTRLGDPIEIAALGKAFQAYTQDTEFCLIGSAKSNIGHCESAAGIAGLTKVLLQMQHQQIVPSLHSAQLNPHIDFPGSPFVVNQTLRPWDQPLIDGRKLPRIAGISSFGAGGSNAHMIVEEYQAPAQQPMGVANVVILLSARTAEQLQQKAGDLLAYVRPRLSTIDLAATAYTLQVGREAMDERLGFVVSSAEQLTEKLQAYLAGEEGIEDAYQGQVRRNKEAVSVFNTDVDLQQTVAKWIANRKLSKLLDLWVKGLELDWSKLYGEVKPQRISLPTYPFARERYWIERATGASSPSGPTAAVLHPLLHTNTSDLTEQRFRSTFTGEEFFVADHQLAANGHASRKVLPGVAYLEMARAAIEHALPARPESTMLELRDTVWAQPIVVSENRQVSIALSASDDDQIDYEIYSQDTEQEIVHCQGHAVLSHQPAPARLDLEQLTGQMGQGQVEPASVYAACARAGLVYGPAFRGITAIHRGSGQLLAQLKLPRTVADNSRDYVLHPSLMDGALQAAVGLIEGGLESNQPRLPFALETLRIVSPCTPEMVAWVRYSPGSQAGDNVVKLDIDLCDANGNVCVQMHGFSSRVQGQPIGSLLARPVWQASGLEASAVVGKIEFAEHHVILCELSKVNVPQGHCLSLQGEKHKTIAQRYNDYALACFERIQDILQSKPQGKVLVQIVIADHQEQALLVGLSGLLKTAALESPQFVGQIILVPAHMMAEELARYLQEEKTLGLDPLVKYEQGARQILRWQDVPAGPDKPPVAFKDNGVYLITGGLGGLGLLFAKEILDKTRAARVVLTGRSALSAEKQALLDGLSAEAGRVTYRQLDLGNLDQVKQLVAAIKDEYGQLNGILHSAGMIADNFILKKTGAEFSQVLAPKVAGTFNLDQACQDVELDFFVLFSSTAGALGNLGQADYATANGFMDQFAAYRNRQVVAKQRHGRTRAINWPLWQAGGMGIDRASLELLQQTIGMRPMQTSTGIDAFHRSLALPYDRMLVVEGDLTQMRRVLAAGRPVAPERSPLQTAAARSITSVTDAAEIDSGSLIEKTQEYLQKQFADLLKLPAHKIDPEAALEEYGIDSVLALRLTSQLEKTFGALSKTLIFEYRTICELRKYFIANFSAQLTALFATAANRRSEAVPVVAPSLVPVETKPISIRRFSRRRSAVPRPTTEPDAIAIIGLSGRYPEAVNIDAYWRNLREGKDCVIEVPKERWDWQAYFSDDRSKSGHHYSKWGGFIAGVDEFDPLFFNISPKEAKYIDPQERLFLQHVWMAIEDAGYTRASLQVPYEQDLESQVGVYVGVMYSEYQLFGAEASMQGKRMGIAASVASIANRVSYALNLHGPSVTLDTMCSSSLTAIHFACQDLKHGRTSLAIAGGVNVSIHPNKYLVLSAGQFISSDGHCQSFGEGGDGYIPGEGVGVVVLKRLSEAKRDGDHIYGIIRGSALTHGGKTNGYTVPNPQAQAGAISRALAESHIDARHISYIEAHGTGTKLGDPIEIAALSKAFHRYTQDTEFCLIGSAKSNIGHCESAAGIAGLTKILLQMQHQQIVPSLHSAQLNPHIDFPRSPFVVNQTLRPWEQPVIDGQKLPRIAGISSFGAGGSNAHMIVEEYQPPVQQSRAVANVVILLSARTAEQLQQKAGDILNFVRARVGTIDLAAMAYTLQIGREAMDERLGFVVSSAEQLIEKLQAYLAGEEGIEHAYQGNVKRNKEALSLFSTDADLKEAINKWIAGGKLSRLADLWVKGLELDWSKLYGESKPQRISLPTYPFAKERYWIDTAAGGPVAAKGTATAVLHPLLHSNTSDLSHQSYSSTFSGEEFFLKGHQVDGQRIFPSAAYLEMARVAVEKAARTSPETLLELRNVVWGPPIVITDKTQVSIALSANDHDQIDYEIYSQDVEQEIVHCQGHAVLSRKPAPAKLDLEQFKGQMGQGHVLARLRLPSTVADTSGDYVLHPSLMDGALQAGVGLIDDSSERAGQARLPFALESLRIVSPCTPQMAAWVRYAPGSQAGDKVARLDIDLCDERGNICAQMRGVSWQPASLDVVEPVIDQSASVRREIVFVHKQASPVPVERKRPVAISLAAPSALVSAAVSSSQGRAPITLSSATSGVSSVRLHDDGHGIFSIDIAASAGSTTRTTDIIAQVLQALDRVRQESSVKVLMIRGAERCFLRGGREDYNDAVEQKLYQAFVSFPYPVIAVLQEDVIGTGFMAAALCDFMVCNEDASYGYTDAERHLYPTPIEAILFGERFGDVQAQDFLYVSTRSTGKQLRAKGWTCPILRSAQVEAYAQQLASTLATKSQDALRLLKQHLTRHLIGVVNELRRVEVAASATEDRSDTPADHVLVIRFGVAGKSVGERVADIRRIFAEIHQVPYYKAVVLAGEDSDFLPRTEQAITEDVVLDFQRIVVESEIPVVAALTGNVRGNAWLIAQLCDASVYSRQGVYSSAGIGQSHLLAQMAAAVFAHRFGNEAANEILLTGAEYSGADLEQRVGALSVAETDHVLPAAVQAAACWARLPRTNLAAWKRHSATRLQEKILSLPAAAGWEQKDETCEPLIAAATPVALHSTVVTATAHPGGIVVVKMEDRHAKNMFSDALVAGVTEAFAHIQKTPAYKVVILTGYDSYFASGGTKEGLLAIQQGKAKFTDFKIFQLPLDCKLPVIAAVQGHGIGAGWSMGMFADIVLLSEEGRYVSPYMNYGFTPGAGATWSLADKIGQDLARESLLTAQPYSGRELKDRGLRLRVLHRADVYPAAMALAQQIAQASRHRLTGLKQQLTGYVHQPLEETYLLELAMHEKTFVGRPDTLAQIQNKFYQEIDTPRAGSQEAHLEAANPPVDSQVQAAAANRSFDSDVLRAVSASLKTLLANELQMPESAVDDNAQFVDLGLDSISGVTWIRKINEKYQTSIEATKVYSHSTLTQLSHYVKEEAEKHGTLPSQGAPLAVDMPVASANSASQHTLPTERAAKKLTSRRSRTASRFVASVPATRPSQPIAVIGMAGQFPQARNLEEFWQNIAGGRNCITEVPGHRWDVNAYYQPGDPVAGKTTSQWAGLLDEYDLFDPLFFNISPTEAESMDPQQRLFLQACWHTIENAGYDARVLSGSKCGVFVGCGSGDYHQLSRRHQLSAQGFTGSALSILAARISYFLNLQGPCVSIDTACSSSLVSIAQACDSLTSGASDLALAGGVYVMVGPEMHIKTSQAGMLSPEGKCFTFDQRANGFVPGEGVGVVLLKRLADAQRDQDIIHAVIHGWGVNQDGKTNGITAPNPESQTRLQQDVYDNFQIDPANVQLMEAHGTGTKLGDPIEVEGLKKAFAKYTQNKEYCALGSVKSNIGHCLAAAGVAGVLKLILALKHKQLPPTINFERLNEHIDLKDTAFYVNSRLREWESGAAQGRGAATSSFGFSGTNAHMVIGEYLSPAEFKRPVTVVTQNTKIIIPLSARTTEQLEQKARDLLNFIRKEARSIDLIEMAYTLQVGREAMDERLGVLVSSVEQLAEKLEAYVKGAPRIEDLHRGQVKRSTESTSIISQDDDVKETIVDKWIANKKLSRLLELWVNGLELGWNKLYGEVKPQRIALPTYPFAKERYWIDTAAVGPVAAKGAAAAVLHPLLHSNTSDLSEQRYSSNFTGEEFFLTDHRVRTEGRTVQKLLPGVAYLEMARAAIKQASPTQPESSILELHNTVWLKPVVVSSPKQVSISLSATDNGCVDYEIYSVEAEQKTAHCQGQAVFGRQSAPARLDIEQLTHQMGQGRLEAADVYTICATMGLNYGPAHQGITAIHLGENQVLAQLRLPAVVETNQHEYVLHPSLMDSALQASIGLLVNLNHVPTKPSVPFAVESLRIVSACTKEMAAWVRYSKGSKPEDKTIKVDIDLCDQLGNVCVQIRGFSSRVLEGDIKPTLQSAFDNSFYQSLIADIVNRNVSVDEAVELA